MSYPTVEQVYDAARAALGGDNEVAGGDMFKNSKLLPHVQRAVRDVWRCVYRFYGPIVLKTRFLILRANTTVLDPRGTVSNASVLLSDMVEPLTVLERGTLTEMTITATTLVTNGVRLTATGHGRATGQRVTVGGCINTDGNAMGGDGHYGITVVDSDNFTANGMVMRTGGTYASGGVAVYSPHRFQPMRKLGNLTAMRATTALQEWSWQEGRFLFIGSDQDRQLAIGYQSAAETPEADDDVIAIPGSVDCLGVMTACYATQTMAPTISAALRLDAFGPSGMRDGTGGMLRDLILPINNAAQVNHDKQRPPIEFLENRIIGFSI